MMTSSVERKKACLEENEGGKKTRGPKTKKKDEDKEKKGEKTANCEARME